MSFCGGGKHFQGVMDGDRVEEDPLEEDDTVGVKREGEDVIIIPSVTVADNMELEDEGGDDDDHRDLGRSAGGVKRVEISVPSHCVFCLRKTTSQNWMPSYQILSAKQSEMLQVVPKAEDLKFPPSGLLSTLNQLWTFLQKKNGGVHSEDVGGTENHPGVFSVLFAGETTAAAFSDLPEMCKFCSEKLESVHKQFVELMREVNKLRDVIRDSKQGGKYSWRAEEFDSVQGCSSVEAAFECLQTLVEEEDGEVATNFDEMPCSSNHINHPSTNSLEHENIGGRTEDDLGQSLMCEELLDPFFEETETGNEDAPDNCDWDNNDMDNESDPDYIKSEEEEDDDEDDSESSRFSDPSDEEEKTEDNRKRKTATSRNAPKAKKQRQEKPKPVPRATSTGVTNPDAQKYVCDLCGWQTPRIRCFHKHKRIVHKQLNRQGRCDLCKDMVNLSEMYAHIAGHVGSDYCIRCPNPECPQVFAIPYNMSFHLYDNMRCKSFVPPQDLPVRFPRNGHTCEVCGLKTKHGQVMRIHLTEKHETANTGNLSCPVSGCDRRFAQRQSVVLHLPHHDFNRNVTTQSCSLCGGGNARIQCAEMECHLKVKHGVQEIIKCNQCAFMFSTREALIDHLYEHRYGVLTCDICADGVRFFKHAELRDHYFKMHQIGQKYGCDQCEGAVYWTKVHLMDHIRRVHGNNAAENPDTGRTKRTFKCEECGIEYKMAVSLRDHKIKAHGADDYYKCRHCGEKFQSITMRSGHEKKHKDLPPKMIPCEMPGCGKSFNGTRALKHHHTATHLGIKAHVCETCGKSFTLACSLKTHVNSVHLKLKPYVCSECGENFSSGQVLKRHMRIHTGERPFACELCGQRFRHREVLKRHLEGHEEKGEAFKPNGPMKQNRKRVELKRKQSD